MKGIEKVSFEIISNVGSARSSFMEAIQYAYQNEFTEARAKIEEGEKLRVKGHNAHFELIQNEAAGNSVEVSLILMHAEDQLMATETIKILAEEMIRNYERMERIEKKIEAN